MNLKLRRTLSSFLAFVMLCSCMVVANAGSVFAAEEVWTPTSSVTWLNTGTGTLTTYTNDRGATFAENIFEDGTNTAINHEGYSYKSGDTFVVDVTGISGSVELNLYMVRAQSGQGTIRYSQGEYDSGNREQFLTANRDGTNIAAIPITIEGGNYYTFYSNSSDVFLFRATISYEGGGSVTPPEETNYTVSLTAGENGMTDVMVGGVDLVSGSEYADGSQVVVTATPNEGFTAAVTVNGSVVPLTNNSYTFTLSQNTTIEVTYTSSSVEPPVTGDVTLEDEINLSDISTGSVSSEIGAGNFQLVPNGGSMSVESASNVEVNGKNITKYVRIGSNASSIKFTPIADGTLYVWARGNSSTAAAIKVSGSDSSETTKNVGNRDDADITMVDFEVKEGVEYTVSRGVATGTNIYLIGTSVECVQPETVATNTNTGATYTSIQAAINAASDNDVITIKTGTYTEQLIIDKPITLKPESGITGDVVIEGDSLGVNDNQAVVNIDAYGVTLENLKVVNTYNLYSYREGNEPTSKLQAAALTINQDCYGATINNCVFESVQDTVILNEGDGAEAAYDANTSKADFNNCTFLGKTDFVCGTGCATFDNCTYEVVLYVYNSENVTDDRDNLVYVFSPTPWSEFVVNGGSIVYDTDYNTDVNSTEDGFATPPTANLYYARIWDKSSLGSSDGETVNLYLNGITSEEVNTTVKSMNGFYCQSINGTIATTDAWLNLYNPAVGTPDNTNYTYSTHDANLFEFVDAMMDGDNIVLYGDFIAGTGTGYDKNEKVEDPVLATIREVGFIVDKTLTAESVTYDADKALSTSTLFTKLVKNTAEGTTEDVHTGNPYTTFCWIDVSGEEVTAENPIEFRLFTYTKYNSNDEYNISSDFATVTYDGTDVTVE